jgi:formylglycine-generating enzyme required for sulfatase activity
MKHFSLLILTLLFFSSQLFADEFIVKSFKKIDNKVLTNKDKVYDDNDELSAIVLVRTSLVDLGISASTPIVGNAEWVEGDYRVNMTAGTKMIKFFKKGFETLEYTFPQRLEKGNFYLLELEYQRTDIVAAGNNMGFVVIDSDPSAADVYINGEATGVKTLFQNPYNEGYYRFSLRKAYYDDYTGDFTINPDETNKVSVKLVPNYGSLELNFLPSSEISVSIDGQISTQSSPYSIEKLSPGNHSLILNKATYDEYQQSFTINKEQTTTLNIEMIPNFGGFSVSTNPEINAKVSIDGIEYQSATPFTIDKLSPGQHSLKLSKAMYLSLEQDFTIAKGESSNLEINMEPTFGTITITAQNGDEIFIDNQKKGEQIYTERLLKGLHIIEVKRTKYYSESRQIDVVPDSVITDCFELLAKTATLSVMTSPIDADIILNNEHQGQTPKFINNLIVGTYNLKFQKQGSATIEKQIEITENKTTSINETLPSAVEVQIISNPDGAKLYVDNVYKGITPITLSLNSDNHSFKLHKDDYNDFPTSKILTTASSKLNFEMKTIIPQTLISKVADIEFVFVKGGAFQMGSNEGEDDEKPVHTVSVNDFYIGKYEVTQEQWGEIMRKNPSYFIGPDLPIENITWNDIQKFINKLNRKTGMNYRLPTEAEWEYAAKGGNQSKGYTYSGSNTMENIAWYNGNSGSKTNKAGTKKANELGIYDMSGNVSEWCSDWYYANYYSNSPRNNPQGQASGAYRVYRSGSWNEDVDRCRVTDREGWLPTGSIYFLGFRLALSSQ